MKKFRLIILVCMCILGFSFLKTTESGIVLKTNSKSQTIIYDGSYDITDKSFKLLFITPKDSSVVVEIVNLTNKKIYDSYLIHKNLENLEAFQNGNALSISVNTYGKISNSLYLSNDSHQVLIHEGRHFSSYSNCDSTETEYTLTHQVKYLDDFRESKSKKIELKKFKEGVIYCIANISVYKNNKWQSISTTPFKLIFK